MEATLAMASLGSQPPVIDNEMLQGEFGVEPAESSDDGQSLAFADLLGENTGEDLSTDISGFYLETVLQMPPPAPVSEINITDGLRTLNAETLVLALTGTELSTPSTRAEGLTAPNLEEGMPAFGEIAELQLDPQGPTTRAAVAQSQGETIAKAVVAENAKRQNLGQPLLDEQFPDGWEQLLAETEPASSKPEIERVQPKSQNATGTQVTAELPMDGLNETMVKKTSNVGPEALQGNRNDRTALDLKQMLAAQAKASQASDLENGLAANSKDHRRGTEKESEQNPDSTFDALRGMHVLREATTLTTLAAKPLVLTPAQTLARLTDMQKQMVVKEFSQSAVEGLKNNEKQLTVELHPPELGRIKLVIETQGDKVHARLTMQDSTIGNFFQDRLDMVRKSLEAAGINIGSLSVEINQQFNLKDKEETATQPGTTGSRLQSTAGSGVLASHPTPRTARWEHSGKVDLLI